MNANKCPDTKIQKNNQKKKRMFGNNINMVLTVQILMSSCRNGLQEGLTTKCKNIKYMFDSKKRFKLRSVDLRINNVHKFNHLIIRDDWK